MFAVGFVAAGLGYLWLGITAFDLVFGLRANPDPDYIDAILEGLTPLPVLVVLFTFGFLTLSVAFVVRSLHRRPFLSLVGPLPLAFRQFAAVFGLLLILAGVMFTLPPWDMGGPLVPNLPMGFWALLLPVSLLAVFVQISAEEIFFRGYVQQQLAARFRSPLIWMALPAGLFGWGHYMPAEAGANAFMIAVWATIFGLLMADLTARAGNLGPAIAVHFYNNIFAILIVSVPDSLSGLALFHGPFNLSDEAAVRAWLPVDFAHMLVAWLVARLVIRR